MPRTRVDMKGPQSGTEIVLRQLRAELADYPMDNINVMISNCDPSALRGGRINILWQHLSYDQPAVQVMHDHSFVDAVDYFVYVSHWQYNRFRERFSIPENKSFVIKNATYPIPADKRSEGKVRLIYTSTPWRGLAVLVKAIEILNRSRDDFEVEIYSSTKIYGAVFDTAHGASFDELFAQCAATRNLTVKGYAPNDTVREALGRSHIFVYPSIFEETSCLAVIEAMMAGCHVVTTNYGALPETCGEFATVIEYDKSIDRLAARYAGTLSMTIDNYKRGLYADSLRAQVAYYQRYYGWEARLIEWRDFFDFAKQRKAAQPH